jgi:F0F1-type ATP synthase membrane subunit b/b'
LISNTQPGKGGAAIDLDYLIDRLEELLDRSWHVPFADKALVDEAEFLRLIDQMRLSKPKDLAQAQQVLRDREQIIAQAREQAEHIRALAQEQADRLVEEHEVLRRAHAEREQILEEARQEAEKIKADAFRWALEVLRDLDEKVASVQQVIRNGISALEGSPSAEALEQPIAQPSPAHTSASDALESSDQEAEE